jgi:hypothetical protein
MKTRGLVDVVSELVVKKRPLTSLHPPNIETVYQPTISIHSARAALKGKVE